MHIKSIVLDGFKSYGQRTEITGWDTEFNAITGLNGTGKSNILDSICFVLGISNLSQVRAATLQDLIYKSGQAGVNKATVSITFDNRNREQSPPGFENYEEFTISRQIVMGGKNKYLLNGINVTNKRIQDLFCSIQMNVNNPHFLIMQGRITKVLNMKAPEILSMIEEAAGTRMYEEKRRQAMKCLEQKGAKLLELNTIIEEEMTPKLEKIMAERKAYMEFQTLERELQHHTKIFQAWQYISSQRYTKIAESALEQGEAELQEMKDNIGKNQEQATQLDAEMAEMIKAADADDDSNLKAAEVKLKAKEKEEAKSASVEKAIKDNISADQKKKKQLEKALIDDEAALKAKEDELAQIQGLFDQLKNNDARDNEAFALSQKKFEAVSAGMEINEDGVAETLQEQLIHAKEEAAQASTEIQQSTKFLNHHQKELKEKQKHMGSNTADYERDRKALEAMEKEVSSLEAQLGELNYSKDRMTENQRRQRALLNEVRSVRERVESFQAQNPNLNFRYRDPETNFNRRRVKGVVARQIKLKDRGNSTAIETAAGGKLYNVIVDNDQTGQKLLQRGNLQNRTTFIPLNKIQGHKINPNVVKFAQDLVGKENVQPALSLITYDSDLQPAMEYVFGSVLICKDLSIARQVTFHDRIRCRCVTLDGDVTDPSGTLSGGAMKKGTPILQQLNDIAQYEMLFKDKQNELTQIEQEIQQMSATHQQFTTLNERYELRQHELGLLRQRLQQTTHHQQQEEIQHLTQTIDELTEKIKQCKETEVTNNRKANDIEGKLKNAKGHREKQLKDAEKDMKRLKKVAEDSRRQWKQREQDYETLKLEISDLRKGLENTDGQLKGNDENMEKLNQQLQEASAALSEIRTIVTEMQKEVKAEKAAVAERNKEVQRKQHKKEQLLAQVAEFELEIKKKSHDIKKLQEEFRTIKARETEYSKKIKADSKALEEANRFTDQDGREMEKKIRTMNEKRQKMSRTVNKKAQNTVDQDEKQFSELLKRKGIVETDKRKIQGTIENLDKQKRETLNLAWKQVSQDFGSIFRTLLPGSDARLEPPPHRTVLEGLEIKVSLGGVWKDSLSELSGGQRSLIALSLVLAMLLFKPAPLYILDEVDAALDLSHTQNIGTMLKAHFKQSQFIIVSLKDGMFNNANVLFRTKFVDGMSVVTRTVNQRR